MNNPVIYEDCYGKRIIVSNCQRHNKKPRNDDDDYTKIVNKLFTTKPIKCETDIKPNDGETKKFRKSFQPGLFVQVDNRTTSEELQKLLEAGARTIFVRLGYATRSELSNIMDLIQTSIEMFQKDKTFKIPIGLAVEMRGDVLRTGRMRNAGSVDITTGSLLVLTCDEKYRTVSQKEIIFISSFGKYLHLMKLADIIFINGGKIILKVVKICGNSVTCCVKKGDTLSSYMDVEVPYFLANKFEPSPEIVEDVQLAIKGNARFVILPILSNVEYVKDFKEYLRSLFYECDIFTSINTCVASNLCLMKQIINTSNGIWLDDFLKRENDQFIVEDSVKELIKLANELNTPIIGKIPVQDRNDFIRLKNHKFLPYLDSILIEKSRKTHTYPLIARKLFCEENEVSPGFPEVGCGNASCSKSMAKCIEYHTTLQQCHALIINTDLSHDTAKHLSRHNVYCPIIMVVDNERIGKQLNVYRNIVPVVFNDKLKDTEANRLEMALDFGMWSKILDEGDFVITLNDSLYYDLMIANKYRAIYVPKRELNFEKYGKLKRA